MATTTSSSPLKDWRDQQRRHHRNQRLSKLALTLITALIVLIFIFPICFWFSVSVKPFRYIFTLPPHLTFPPNEITGAWYSTVIGGRPYADVIRAEVGTTSSTGGAGIGGYYVIPFLQASIIIGLSSTAIVILIAVITAYALSRFNLRFKQNIIFFILSTRFMPGVAVVLPLYLMYKQFGWIDTYGGLILAHAVINLPLAILLLKSFFDDVPQDLDDAAMVDGCTRFGAFRRIIIRYVAPGVAAAAVLVLIFSWNEFLFTLYLTRSEIRTVPVAMSTFDSSSGGTEWGFMAAAGSAAMIPVFIFILFVQRHLIRGLTMGAVRG
jgi:multiple sugar transport system permease protein